MTKTILILAITVAFVAGTITTGSIAFAHIDICAQPSVDSLKSAWHGLCDLQQQIDNISQGVQVDQQGNTAVNNDLTVAGNTFLGDTTINSDLIVGPTNIDSVTGNTFIGGNLTVLDGKNTILGNTTLGVNFTSILTAGTLTINSTSGDLDCDGCIESSDIAAGVIPAAFQTYIRSASCLFAGPNLFCSVIASCDSGDLVTGGGYASSGAQVLSQGPTLFVPHTGWEISALKGGGAGAGITARAVCVDITP